MTKKEYWGLDYPMNLIEAINGRCGYGAPPDGEYECIEIEPNEMQPKDWRGSVEYMLYTLTDRERTVLELRFRDHLTIEEAAKPFNVTRERIRQVEAKALRKLRHPDRYKYIRYGVQGVMNQKIEAALQERYDSGFRDGYCQHEKDGGVHCAGDFSTFEPERAQPHIAIETRALEACEFSVRTFNCLKRAGCNKLGDVQDMGDAIYRVRNLGRKSIEEIERYFEQVGLIPTWRG